MNTNQKIVAGLGAGLLALGGIAVIGGSAEAETPSAGQTTVSTTAPTPEPAPAQDEPLTNGDVIMTYVYVSEDMSDIFYGLSDAVAAGDVDEANALTDELEAKAYEGLGLLPYPQNDELNEEWDAAMYSYIDAADAAQAGDIEGTFDALEEGNEHMTNATASIS